jgi:hypothetical protein
MALYLSDMLTGVEHATFLENLDQMEPVRIPNDREHEFFRLNCVSFSFGNFSPRGSQRNS